MVWCKMLSVNLQKNKQKMMMFIDLEDTSWYHRNVLHKDTCSSNFYQAGDVSVRSETSILGQEFQL